MIHGCGCLCGSGACQCVGGSKGYCPDLQVAGSLMPHPGCRLSHRDPLVRSRGLLAPHKAICARRVSGTHVAGVGCCSRGGTPVRQSRTSAVLCPTTARARAVFRAERGTSSAGRTCRTPDRERTAQRLGAGAPAGYPISKAAAPSRLVAASARHCWPPTGWAGSGGIGQSAHGKQRTV